MSDRFHTLLQEARRLPVDELRLLVEALEESLEADASPAGYQGDEELVQRFMKRRQELISGARKSISREELMRRVQKNLAK